MVDTTLFKLNFPGFLEIGWFTVITLVVTFCIIDMFDTIGTLVGTASRAGILDEEGNMPQMKEALLAMPVSGSIGHGIGLALITYTFMNVATGKTKDVSALTYILSLIFLVKFFLVA